LCREGLAGKFQRTARQTGTQQTSEKKSLVDLNVKTEAVCFLLSLCGQITSYMWVFLAQRLTKIQKTSGAQMISTHD
jgi:hypothetical protein